MYPTCQAPHPDRRKDGQACGARLGAIEGPVRFLYVVPRMHEDGRIYLCCTRQSCRAWNVFERVVGDGDAR